MKLTGTYSDSDEIAHGEDAYSYTNNRFSLIWNEVLRGSLGPDDSDLYQLEVAVNALYKLNISTDPANDWGTGWTQGEVEVTFRSGSLTSAPIKVLAGEDESFYFIHTNPNAALPQIRVTGSDGANYAVSLEKVTNYVSPTTIADDQADSFQTASTVLQLGQTQTASIEHQFDTDFFKINLEAGKTYTVSLTGSTSGGGTLNPLGGGTGLAVIELSALGVQSAVNSRFGEEPAFTFSAPITGVYYVGVSELLTQGTYSLLVTEAAVPDDYLTTSSISINTDVTGTIDNQGDKDTFKIALTAGTAYSFTLSGAESGLGTLGSNGMANEEPLLMLWGSLLGSEVWPASTMGGSNGEAVIQFIPKSTGNYYLDVSALMGSGTGTYHLSIAAATGVDDYGSDQATAGTLAIGGEQEGDLENAGDRDWFAVNLTGNAEYTFALKGKVSGAGTLPEVGTETRLAIYDAAGVLKSTAYGVAYVTLVDPLLTYLAPSSGTYYLSVEGPDGIETGTYSVSAQQTADDFLNTTQTTGTLVVGGEQAGAIQYKGDSDWLKVNLTAGELYFAQLDKVLNGIGLTLYDSSGNATSGAYSQQGSASPTLSFTPSTTGTYFVGIADRDNVRTGSYLLQLAEDDHGNRRENATTLTKNTSVDGQLNLIDDQDWFAVDMVADKGYQFVIADVLPEGETSSTLRMMLYQGDQFEELRYSYVSEGDLYLDYFAKAPGQFYLRVEGNTEQSPVAYTVELVENGDDYGNDYSQASQSLSIGGQVSGNIEIPSDEDWFSVQLTEGVAYQLQLSGADSGGGTLAAGSVSRLSLNSPSLLIAASNGANGSDPVMTIVADYTGTHYLAVDTLSNNGTGTYTLKVTQQNLPPPSSDDYSANSSTTGVLNSGDQLTGRIDYADDDDWIRVNLSAGVIYQFNLTGFEGGGGSLIIDPDTFLRLLDSTGMAIQTVQQVGTSGLPAIRYAPESAGTYFLLVDRDQSSASALGTYTLHSTVVVDDYGSDISTTDVLKAGDTRHGEFEIPTDKDWFKLDLKEGFEYAFEMLGAAGGGGTATRLGLAITDANGVNKVSDIYFGTGGHPGATVTFIPQSSGTYYLAAGSVFSGSAYGTYTVKMSLVSQPDVEDDYANDDSTTALLPIGGELEGNIETESDKDWFKVTLTAGKQYVFELGGPESDAGTLEQSNLFFYDSSGNSIERIGNSVGSAIPLSFEYLATQSGIHYLEVSSYRMAGGDPGTFKGTYTLQADVVGNNPATGQPFIYGDALPGKTLLAEIRSIADVDDLGDLNFQWLRNGESIPGATGKNYVVQQGDIDRAIAVQVSYVDGAGNDETLLSEARIPTEPLNDAYTKLIEMYVIILGRAPAQSGLEFWSSKIDDGRTFEDVANAMWNSPGAQDTYPETLSDEEKVTTVYRNVLVREPKAEGLQFWLQRWQDEDIGPVKTMLAMIDALTANNSSDPQAILDKVLFEAKVDIGGYLATSVGNSDIDLAAFAFNYLESGHSINETRQYIDQQLQPIGQMAMADEALL